MALRYPSSISGNIPFVTFSIYESRSGANTSSGPDVVLFMPPAFQITDGQEYEFAEKGTVNKIVEALGGLAEGEVSSAIKAIADSFKGGFFKSDVAQQLAKAGEAARDPKFFNYKEPRPREFTFTYKFEPKNPQDAQAMLQIINTLRVASYPTALAGGMAYKVPSSIKISFNGVNPGFGSGSSPGGRTVTVLPNFWAIKEVNTTLSEGDQMMTFSDGIPTQVSLQLQLMETVLLTKSGNSLAGDVNSEA